MAIKWTNKSAINREIDMAERHTDPQTFVGPCIFRLFENFLFGITKSKVSVDGLCEIYLVEYHKIDLTFLYTGTQLNVASIFIFI